MPNPHRVRHQCKHPKSQRIHHPSLRRKKKEKGIHTIPEPTATNESRTYEPSKINRTINVHQ